MPNTGGVHHHGASGTIDKRALLFPICSGTLGVISVAMQIVAVATSYWAHFKRERDRHTEFIADGINTVLDPLYEEGHYGLWTVCLTVFDGQPLEKEDCITNIAHFHPSSWRIFAGIIATINVVLALLFLATIPFQVRHLKTGRPLCCKYKTLTRIKMVLSIVGVICAIMAAVLFGIHSHHKHYKEPKGWSFGLQIIVIVVQVFLLISSSAENVVASRIDQCSPEPQYSFSISSSKKALTEVSKSDSFKYPSLNPTLSLSSTNTKKLISAIKKENEAKHASLNREFSRENPIFIDSDNETNDRKGSTISVIHVPVTVNHVNRAGVSVRIHQNSGHKMDDLNDNLSARTETPLSFGTLNRATAIGRFRVEKIADMYTAAKNDANSAYAYDNAAYSKDPEESLPNGR